MDNRATDERRGDCRTDEHQAGFLLRKLDHLGAGRQMIGLRALSAICIIIDHFYMSHLFDVGFSISACLSIKLCQFLLGVTSKNTAAFLIDMSPIFPLSINDPDVNMIHPKLFCNLWQLLFAQVSTDFFHDRFQFPRLNEAIGVLKKQKLHRPDQQHNCTKTQQCRRKDFLSSLLPAVAFPFCLISLQNDSQLL